MPKESAFPTAGRVDILSAERGTPSRSTAACSTASLSGICQLASNAFGTQPARALLDPRW